MKFYTIQKFISDFYERKSASMRCTAENYDDFIKWRDIAKRRFRDDLGITNLEEYLCEIGYNKKIPEVISSESKEFDDYTRVKLYMETMPSVIMPVYMLIPKSEKINGEAVIAAHGHCGGGKEAIVGNGENPAIAEQIRPFDYDYGIEYVKKGYIVFAPDAMGFGERREGGYQSDSNVLSSSCHLLAHILNPLGLSVSGMWTYELMRLADYALSLENVEKLHCVGLSGGGLQTLYFTALDERVESAVISGYFYGVKESLIDLPMNCDCNFAHSYMLDFDMGDIAAMAAPRKITIQTGDNDGLNGVNGARNAQSQVEIARRAYKLCGSEQNLIHKIYSGGHKWYGFEEL